MFVHVLWQKAAPNRPFTRHSHATRIGETLGTYRATSSTLRAKWPRRSSRSTNALVGTLERIGWQQVWQGRFATWHLKMVGFSGFLHVLVRFPEIPDFWRWSPMVLGCFRNDTGLVHHVYILFSSSVHVKFRYVYLLCLVLRCFIHDLISDLPCQLSGSQRLKAYGLEADPWRREGWHGDGAREHQETSKCWNLCTIMFLNFNQKVTIRSIMIGHSISFEIHPNSKVFFKHRFIYFTGVWCLISFDFLFHSMEDPSKLTLRRRQEVNWKFLGL